MSGLQGVGAAPGAASGPPLVIRDDGHAEVRPGAILVGKVIHPHHAPLFLTVGGVVAEDGGLLQHAAILAREFGIPAVIGVAGAVAALGAATSVTIDGTLGTVDAVYQ